MTDNPREMLGHLLPLAQKGRSIHETPSAPEPSRLREFKIGDLRRLDKADQFKCTGSFVFTTSAVKRAAPVIAAYTCEVDG